MADQNHRQQRLPASQLRFGHARERGPNPPSHKPPTAALSATPDRAGAAGHPSNLTVSRQEHCHVQRRWYA